MRHGWQGDHHDVTYLTFLGSGIGDDAAVAIAGMEHFSHAQLEKAG